MLTPEDVLAARILFHKIPHDRDQLIDALEARRTGATETPLVGNLEAEGVLNRLQAGWVEREVEGAKQDRLEQIYAYVLVGAGVEPAAVQGLIDGSWIPTQDPASLGDALVKAGGVGAREGAQLLQRARDLLASELDALTRVSSFRSQGGDQNEVEGEQEERGDRPSPDPSASRLQSQLVAEGESPAPRKTKLLFKATRRRDRLERLQRTIAVGPPRDVGQGIERTIALDPSAIEKILQRPVDASEPLADHRKLDPLLVATPTPVEECTIDATLSLDPAESARLFASIPGSAPAPLEAADGFAAPFEVPPWVDETDPRRGEVVEDFRILGRIGAGGQGTVYLAQQRGYAAREVALKLLASHAAPEAKGRFDREILANSLFSHPGALDVYGAGCTPDGQHFLAMEFFHGKDVGTWLEKEGHLQPKLGVWVALQVLETLLAVHDANIVHRDLKPANILLGEDREAKLMDFGIAVVHGLEEFDHQLFHTMGSAVTGTPEYLSPEAASGVPVGPPADIYSLGCVLYQMLSGRLPYTSSSSSGYLACHLAEDPIPLEEAAPHTASLPPQLTGLVARMLAKDEDDRPTDAGAIAELRASLGVLLRA